MKKIFSVMVVCLMFALFIPNLVFADDTINVIVENKLITQGDKNVSVSIDISNNPGIALLTFKVKYDSTIMNLVSVDNGNLFPKDGITLGNIAKNPYTVLMLNASKNSTRNGTLVTLNFNIKNSNSINKTDIIISRAEAYNIDEESVPVNVKNGGITISEKEKLDLSGISFPGKEFTYDGLEKSISISGNLPVGVNAKVVYENEKAIDAGEYNVKATITADGYNDLVLNSTITIHPKELSVSNIKASDKTYDGTTQATITGGIVSGVVKGDNVIAVFPTSGIFASANVGTDILVSVDDVVLNGKGNYNYKVSQITNLKANITQAPVSISAINIDEKTAVLTGVLKSDKQVELDFEQLKLDIGGIIDFETSKVTFTNFVLKGDKSSNYAVITDKVEGIIKANNLVSIKVSATNGTVTGAGMYTKGSNVTVKATPNSGYKFERWTVLDKTVSTNDTYSFVIEENMELVAEFTKKPAEDGESSGDEGSAGYGEGSAGGGGGSAGGGGGSAGGGGGSAGGGGGAGGTATKPVENPKEDVNEKAEEIKDDTSNNDVGTNTKPMKFTDVKETDWYYDAVAFAYKNGITSGTSESSFSPNDKVTRGQFITMLCRAYEIPEISGENFGDAGNTWYTGYLAAAKQLGISNGVGGNNFEPEKNITREEMVTLIYNYLKSMGEVEATNNTTDFKDKGSISDWAYESVAYAYHNGIVNGKGNNIFDPKGNATRAELAQIFFNMLK